MLSSIQKVQKIVVVLQIQAMDKVVDVYYEKNLEAFKTSMIIEHKLFDESIRRRTQELATTRRHKTCSTTMMLLSS